MDVSPDPDRAHYRRPKFPARALPLIPRLRLVRGRKSENVILSDTVTQAYTHWCSNRSVPCVGNCVFCAEGITVRWQGWIFVADAETLRVMTFTFHPDTAEQVPTMLMRDAQIRGRGLEVRCCADGFYRCRFIPRLYKSCALGDLPAVPSMEQHLRRLWHGDAVDPQLHFEFMGDQK